VLPDKTAGDFAVAAAQFGRIPAADLEAISISSLAAATDCDPRAEIGSL
jgi:hypothetical protein